MEELVYNIPGSNQRLVLCPKVIETFDKHRQVNKKDTEVGGQLFAEISPHSVKVMVASGPYLFDRKTRFSFIPCRNQEKIDILKYFNEGLHYVGDWHTHPQQRPSPSQQDLISIQDCFRKSKHELMGFMLIIVGTDCFPNGLWLSLHDHSSYTQLASQNKS